jgi:hypothetical protein
LAEHAENLTGLLREHVSSDDSMIATEREKQWMDAWRRAGERLAEFERDELPATDTQKSLMNLADAYESCRLHHPPEPTSGLVEMQRWFKKLRERQGL